MPSLFGKLETLSECFSMMYHVEILLPKAHNSLRHLQLYEPIVHKNVF